MEKPVFGEIEMTEKEKEEVVMTFSELIKWLKNPDCIEGQRLTDGTKVIFNTKDRSHLQFLSAYIEKDGVLQIDVGDPGE